ncbi:LysM peptidoglycan-binding domain-containing protein [Bacillus sp. FJAT-27251]|uniref:cell division suppressor protein YneA n=1 Tax=Bacillus sp. FJAT-27251 TaxID=1684142 RepID=UPI0006A79F92|nr:LysM peptidoglycan-binding domain-containing protein [Bacillus sp. FJAT-27251]
MKKVWERYSYVLVLFAVSLIFSAVMAGHLSDEEEYITVTVKEGESLWELAEDLSDGHNLSKHEFISWVEKENGIIGGRILAGEELIVPIITESFDSTQIAQAD